MVSGIHLSDFGFGFTINGFIDKALILFMILFIAGIVGGFAFLFMKFRKKKASPQNKKIGWWEDVQGKLIPTSMDSAKEIIIPGTRLRVFYIKSKDMWLPRFTRGITQELFYIAITTRREIVNFTLKSISQDMAEAGLDYDHTDMIWASENLREFIKRNYRDKSQPWWKAYQGAITVAIYIIILTFSFVIILYFMRELIGDIGGLIGGVERLLDRMDSMTNQQSGIALAPTVASAFIPFLIPKFASRKN